MMSNAAILQTPNECNILTNAEDDLMYYFKQAIPTASAAYYNNLPSRCFFLIPGMCFFTFLPLWPKLLSPSCV